LHHGAREHEAERDTIWFCRDQPPSPGAANICKTLLVAAILSLPCASIAKTITRFGFERAERFQNLTTN